MREPEIRRFGKQEHFLTDRNNVRYMRKVLVTVSQASDGTFWCHTEKDVYGTGLNAAGQTVKEAKDDLLACLEEAKADYEESGKTAEPVFLMDS